MAEPVAVSWSKAKVSSIVVRGPAQVVGFDLIQNRPHLGVARKSVQAKDRAQVVIERPPLEGQQGRVLECKERQAGHQGIGQGKGRAPALFGELLETVTEKADERIEMEVAA